MADKSWKNNNMLLREGESRIEKTHYEFIKDGKKYASMGKNLYDAVQNIEMDGVDLTGAKYTEFYKLKPVRKGIVK